MHTFLTLYKQDSKGKTRVWRMEQDGPRYRTISGLRDGKQVTTEWTVAEAKNVGRANATTPEQQAAAEIESQYALKLRKDYHDSIDDIAEAKFFKPMLAKDYEKARGKIDWSAGVYVQPKLDGIRCIANAAGLWSRTGKPIEAVPHIAAALAPLFREQPGLVLDGELYNHDLRDNFNEIVSMVRKNKPTPEQLNVAERMVQYHVYDVPSVNDTFIERILTFGALCQKNPGPKGGMPHAIRAVPTHDAYSEAEADELYAEFLQQGYEGGIIRLDGPYEQKRSSLLLKRKDFEDAEYTITAIEPGQGNWSGVAKVVHCELPDGREFKATVKGSKEYARHVLDNRDSYIGKQVTVQYFALTPDGIPRFPIAKQLHDDQRW